MPSVGVVYGALPSMFANGELLLSRGVTHYDDKYHKVTVNLIRLARWLCLSKNSFEIHTVSFGKTMCGQYSAVR
jgi:hypothetical protein